MEIFVTGGAGFIVRTALRGEGLHFARGSLFETVTLLEILRRRSWVKEDEFLQ